MLVYKNYLLPEVQSLLNALQALHLGVSSSLPPLSEEAKTEAYRIWRNRRRELLSHIREGFSEIDDFHASIGQTENHYTVFRKGKLVWVAKPDLRRLRDQISWYNASDFYLDSIDLSVGFDQVITAPLDGFINEFTLRDDEDIRFEINTCENVPSKTAHSYLTAILSWTALKAFIFFQVLVVLMIESDTYAEVVSSAFLTFSLFMALFRSK